MAGSSEKSEVLFCSIVLIRHPVWRHAPRYPLTILRKIIINRLYDGIVVCSSRQFSTWPA